MDFWLEKYHFPTRSIFGFAGSRCGERYLWPADSTRIERPKEKCVDVEALASKSNQINDTIKNALHNWFVELDIPHLFFAICCVRQRFADIIEVTKLHMNPEPVTETAAMQLHIHWKKEKLKCGSISHCITRSDFTFIGLNFCAIILLLH